mgnify:CR=1 FL=1
MYTKVYLIVGASGTIGSAVAKYLPAEGVGLGLHYCRNRNVIHEMLPVFQNVGAICHPMQSSLDSEISCRALVDDCFRQFQAIDGIALCGGTVAWNEWQSLHEADWNAMFFQHCIAPFVIAQQAIPLMAARGGGSVVFLSSIAPKYGGSPKSMHYAAAKGALETAMYGLSKEVARYGIRINGVRAGFIHSPQHERGRSAEEIAERIKKIPMGRAGIPEDVASTITYLLSDASKFITGEIIAVAGGD